MEFQSKYSVILVGAGISGISSAKILVENQVDDILILEADDRIGGRIKKEVFSGCPVEVGASWISGVGGRLSNPVWELANKCNIRTCLTDASSARHNVYDSSSGKCTIADEQYKEAVNTYNMGYPVKRSVECLTPIERAIDFVLHDFEIPDVFPTPTFEHFGKKEVLVADEKGYEHIVYKLAESFLHTKEGKIMDRRLKLNKVVREVEYTKSGVLIRTEDGCSYEAKYAIFSINIGVLQSDLIRFMPHLPVWKTEAIKKCEVKVFTKIFLKFPYKFWPCDPQSDFFIYTHERRGYYTLWQHMETIYPGSSILVVTLTNEESKRVEAQRDEETLKETMEVLRSMFGHQIPDPLDILIPRWWNNKFQRGSYSNYLLHDTPQLVNLIKAPIDRIYFTGEHTSEKFSGYVHGAYLAGVDTGITILKEMGLKRSDECKMKINFDQARVRGGFT